MAKDGVRIKCRQILELVYDYHKLDEANGSLFTIEDILHVEPIGDKLAKFKHDWDATIIGQSKTLEEE